MNKVICLIICAIGLIVMLLSPIIYAEPFRVNVNEANVRLGPGTNYLVIQVLKQDELVTVITEQSGWVNIHWGQDNSGWIAKKLLRVAQVDRSSRNLVRIKASANRSKQRYALIIGNSAYPVGPLNNPKNDAGDMADALQDVGFVVTKLVDATQRQMEQAIRQFGKLLNQNNESVGLFYYAGHGLQLGSNNYLIPVDAQIEVENDIKYEAVNVGRVLDAMDRATNRLNMVFLDACRDNPFKRSFRSLAKGLAQMDAPSGTLIAYATSPGKTAADGIGRNGIFTKYLLKHMSQPDEPVEMLLKRVRSDVMLETNHRQTPWESSSLVGNFFFVGQGAPIIDRMTSTAEQPLLGQVTIHSEPQGAKIYLNDIFEDQAPLTISLDPAVVNIRAEKPGYLAAKEQVRIRKGRELKVTLLMKPVEVKENTTITIQPENGRALTKGRSEKFIESIFVSSTTQLPTISRSVLKPTKRYRIEVSGTYEAGPSIISDADYSLTRDSAGDFWTDNVTKHEKYGERLLNLLVHGHGNNGSIEWGEFDGNHVYSTIVRGEGSPIQFVLYDIYDKNNTGGLTVKIYEINYPLN